MVWMLEKLINAMDTSRGVEKMAWITDFKGTGMRLVSSFARLALVSRGCTKHEMMIVSSTEWPPCHTSILAWTACTRC